ncbi:glycosyltransferase family 4 protein [Psychrobacter faecalis]|uniref:glycosyltransferase family 4 protein n=1 Tax=Psychrobacter faecalis TaxID=180588 RepID=UPI003FCF1E04
MKFLILASFASSLTGFRKPLIQALISQGFDVYAVAPELLSNTKVLSELSAMGATCHDAPLSRTGMNPVSDLKTLLALRRLMKSIQPDYFLGYTIKPVIYGNLAAWLAGVPHRIALITGLGYAFVDDDKSLKRKAVNQVVVRLYTTALSRCQVVFFQNRDDETLFQDSGIISKKTNSVVVNGSGVPIEEYIYEPAPIQSSLSFFLMSRLIAAKGVRIYADAARIVKEKHPDANFILAGELDSNPDGIQQKELDRWIKEGLIDYRGRLNDVKPVLKECSVFVLPSYYREGVPRSILEALATGRAIITTDSVGCRETVVEGENGFLVPIKDASTLAEAMLKFIEQPELIDRMGKRSREMAEQKYDVHKVNNHMLSEMGIVAVR